jgi:hypothetical protein
MTRSLAVRFWGVCGLPGGPWEWEVLVDGKWLKAGEMERDGGPRVVERAFHGRRLLSVVGGDRSETQECTWLCWADEEPAEPKAEGA